MKNPVRSVVFVLLYTFILLELGLFLSGKFLLWQHRERTFSPGDIRIVCIGDSHTFGVGTSAPYSYPKQLEKILNSNNPGKKFSVLNLGVPGSSTRSQSAELDSFFTKDRADVVLWLTGRNNTEKDMKLWQEKALASRVPIFLSHLKSIRFLRWISRSLSKKDASLEIPEPSEASQTYIDYLNYYLEITGKLCDDQRARLILLSYYNSSDSFVRAFANKAHLPFFDLTNAFQLFFKEKDPARFISPDNSHMNRLGYQFYSKCLYEEMFLHQKSLRLHLDPLLPKKGGEDFYSSQDEIERCVRSQQTRVEQSKQTWTYPFEQIQLGHIYSEIGDEASAKQCFLEGLVSSEYGDNNMLVTPILTWYLKKGQRQEALKLCNEILAHNPKNSIARYHQKKLSENPS